MSPVEIVKLDGARESFDEKKLRFSLIRAGANQLITDEVMKEVKLHIKDGMSTSRIYQFAFEVLHRVSKPLAVKYSLRRALMELGPDGFPFEKFVAALFRAKGYETLTDQMVQGNCVEHEMDVIAWKGNNIDTPSELIMIEAKFHNELGYKSDLKVALYVKARFDDISKCHFTHQGVERTLTKGVLVTNTKFTEHAIRYGECQGLSMIGWNYPAQGNLQHLIEETKVHPITALTSLSITDKKYLLKNGIILVSEVLRDKDKLVEYGIDRRKVRDIVTEANNMTSQ